MYRDNCGAADRASVVKWWKTPDTDPALIPGGFPESVFANSAETRYEYAYIKDRKGFIRICVEAGKDIVPCYTFQVNRMYYNPAILRGWRARMSSRIHIGLVLYMGYMGTAMPLTDKTTTVIFPPFEASRYSPSQIDEAHAAYLEHLKTHFNLHKANYGMKGVELVFIGSDFQDRDWFAGGLERIGMISQPVTKQSASKRRLAVLSKQVDLGRAGFGDEELDFKLPDIKEPRIILAL